MSDALEQAIAAEIAAHGTILPPWIKYPNIPRESIGWRMGGGEWHLDIWRAWWARQDEDSRAAYRARWRVDMPSTWADWLKP